jgi:hypothetical protein
MDIGCRGQPLPEPDLLSQVQGLAPAKVVAAYPRPSATVKFVLHSK